jgi:hypothetical protein
MATANEPAQEAQAKWKPRKKDRSLRVLSVLRDGTLVVKVEEKGPRSCHTTHYFVSRLPADFGKALRWEKFAADGGEVYEANVGSDTESAICGCLGHLKNGHKTVCKHVAGSRALLSSGWLND